MTNILELLNDRGNLQHIPYTFGIILCKKKDCSICQRMEINLCIPKIFNGELHRVVTIFLTIDNGFTLVLACLLPGSNCRAYNLKSCNIICKLLESLKTISQQRQCELCALTEMQTQLRRQICEARRIIEVNLLFPCADFLYTWCDTSKYRSRLKTPCSHDCKIIIYQLRCMHLILL